MVDQLQHDIFEKNLNTKFKILVDESTTLDVELTYVSDHMVSPAQERFSIEFRAPKVGILRQGVWRLEHEQMGQFELFLVPIRQDDEGFYYEAVFNRVRTKESPSP